MTSPPRRYIRLRGKEVCRACGHAGWCAKSEDESAAYCQRLPSRYPAKGIGTGWFHYFKDGHVAPLASPRMHADAPKLSNAQLEDLAREYATGVHPDRLAKLSDFLSLSVESLRNLDIGWDGKAWTFPMRTPDGKLTGFRRRFPDGSKKSLFGGKEGLFIPKNVQNFAHLLICEGPTSLAALLDWGFDAIGRPSCTGGTEMVIAYLKATGRRDVVIVGDHDQEKKRPDGSTFKPGQDGADKLAPAICKLNKSTKVVIPPRCNDCRDWKRSGVSRAVVDAVIRSANYFRPA